MISNVSSRTRSRVKADRAAAGRSRASSSNSNRIKKPGQAGRQQEEEDKKWRDVVDPGQEPGTGSVGT